MHARPQSGKWPAALHFRRSCDGRRQYIGYLGFAELQSVRAYRIVPRNLLIPRSAERRRGKMAGLSLTNRALLDPTRKSSGYSNKPHRRVLFSPRDTRTSAYCANVYIDHFCIRFSHRIYRQDVRLSNWESSEIGETRRLTLSPGGTSLVYPHSTRL